MVVPYGDNRFPNTIKNAFDAAEDGLGIIILHFSRQNFLTPKNPCLFPPKFFLHNFSSISYHFFPAKILFIPILLPINYFHIAFPPKLLNFLFYIFQSINYHITFFPPNLLSISYSIISNR